MFLLDLSAFLLFVHHNISFIRTECYFQFSIFFEMLFPYWPGLIWYTSVNPQLSRHHRLI